MLGGKDSEGWGKGESYLSSPSLQSNFFRRSLTFHCTPLSTSRERGPRSVATNCLNYQTFLSKISVVRTSSRL